MISTGSVWRMCNVHSQAISIRALLSIYISMQTFCTGSNACSISSCPETDVFNDDMMMKLYDSRLDR